VSSDVELRELRVFLTVAEELHFGRAAERLFLTTSRVSQTIRLLEARVGGTLFDRTSRRVSLTPLGMQLLERAGPLCAALDRVMSETRDAAMGIAGTLRLGMYTPINGGPYLYEIMRTFEARHPACHVELVDTGFARSQFDWLRHDDVDLLAMRLPVAEPGIVIGPVLSREARLAAVATGHPLAERGSISVEDLADYVLPDVPTLPRDLVDAFIPPRTPSGRLFRRMKITTITESLMRVATGEIVHLTVRPFLDHHRHPGVVAVPVTDMPPSETALVWLAAKQGRKTTAFVEAARAVLGTYFADGDSTGHHRATAAV
jgi:DNA-binding transcriptional LysR family regulator